MPHNKNQRIPAYLKEAAEPSINENVPGMGGIPQSAGGDYGMVRQPYDKGIDDTDKISRPEEPVEKKWSCMYDEDNTTWHFYYGEEEVASLPVQEVDIESYQDGYGNLAIDDLTSDAFGKQMLEQAKAKYEAQHKEDAKTELRDENHLNEDSNTSLNKIPQPNKAIPNTNPGEGDNTVPSATDGEFSIATGSKEIRRSTMEDKELFNKIKAKLSQRVQALKAERANQSEDYGDEEAKQPASTPSATETPVKDKEVAARAWYAKFVDPDSPSFNPVMAAEFLAAGNPMEKCMGPIKNYETVGTSDFDKAFNDAERAKPQKQTDTMQQPYEKGTQRPYPKGKDQIGQAGEVIPGGVKMSKAHKFGEPLETATPKYPHEAMPIRISRIEKTSNEDMPPIPDKEEGPPTPKMDKLPDDGKGDPQKKMPKKDNKKKVTCPNCGTKFDVNCGDDGRGRPPGSKNKPKDEGVPGDASKPPTPGPAGSPEDPGMKNANNESEAISDEEVAAVLAQFNITADETNSVFGDNNEEAINMMREISEAETSLEDQLIAAENEDAEMTQEVEAANEFINQAAAMHAAEKPDNDRIATDEQRESWINTTVSLATTLADKQSKNLDVNGYKEHLSGLPDRKLVHEAAKVARSYQAYSTGEIEDSDDYLDMEAVADLEERTAANAAKNLNIFGRVKDHTRPNLP